MAAHETGTHGRDELMPWEFGALRNEPEPFNDCPLCGRVFGSFMRGMVHNGWRKFWRLEYSAVICQHCKEIVGYEMPYSFEKKEFRGDQLQGL